MCTSITGVLDRADRVVQREAGVGQRAGVEQHRLHPLGLRLVQPVAQVALVVRLAHVDREPERRRLSSSRAAMSSSVSEP
jgi:hypothetical protein